MTARLGGRFCRVLSGQRREEVARADGVRWTVECITSLSTMRRNRNVVLTMENHYKDGYWLYPEFAQHLDVFLEIIESDRFAVVRGELRSVECDYCR